MPKQIPLTQGHFALVDDSDYDRLMQHSWHIRGIRGRLYAARTLNLVIEGKKKTKALKMHREIMGRRDGYVVDHESRDSLDNRRSNLRWATPSQNSANRKPHGDRLFKGVTKRKCGTFRARIGNGYKVINLGTFNSAKDAAMAYDMEAVKIYGAFSNVNFPKTKGV